MLAMGDEVRRTQLGNNNAYCHDSELTWMPWDGLERHADLRQFIRTLIGLRFSFDPESQDEDRSLQEYLELAAIQWHGVRLNRPDWSHDSRSLAVGFSAHGRGGRIYCAFNAYWEALAFEMPPTRTRWRRLVDTARASPEDARGWAQARPVEGPSLRVEPRSVVVLGSATFSTILRSSRPRGS
jgi:glycogen operon protein